MLAVHGVICHTKTFPTTCQYCEAPVYFFTCDCGSRVFFDDLGSPWPLHIDSCPILATRPNRPKPAANPSRLLASRTKGPKPPAKPSPHQVFNNLGRVSFVQGDPKTSGLLLGLRRGDSVVDAGVVRRARESQSLSFHRDIMPMKPEGAKKTKIIGVVRDVFHREINERFGSSPGTLAYDASLKVFGDQNIVQMTVFVDEYATDPSAVDFFSYTFFISRKKLKGDYPKGTTIEATIVPVKLFGYGSVWRASNVERLL